MKKTFLSDIKRIKEASLNDKLVVFIGAGVSLNSGVPNWGKLIDSFKDELPENITKNENDYLKIAQIYKNYRGKKEYLEKVKSVLKDGIARYNPINEVIFELKPSHIITTNYDNLFEQVIKNKNYQYYKINKDRDLPYASYNKYLIKMHGDFEEGNIILTEDDYLNYNTNFPLIESYIMSLFASKLVVFIGFSFNDYNLKVITNKVKNFLGNDFPYMYLLNTEETDCVISEYYKKKGIKIINCNDSILNVSNNYLPITKHPELPDDKGVKLYNLINFIKEFNPISFEVDNNNIIDYFFEVKNYYLNEVPVVGGKEITKLFPFNSQKETNYQGLTLTYENEELFALQSRLKGSFTEKKAFLEKYGQKYYNLTKIAKCNGVFKINSNKSNNSISFSNYLIDRKKDGVDLLYELNFNELKKHINQLKQNEINEIKISDLELPYLLYKTGDFCESYKIFKSIAQKCWEQNKYILYFICQNNQKRIANLAAFSLNNNCKNYNIYIKEAQSIDLDEILSKIQNKNELLYNVLKKLQILVR